jgi:glycosyltransferase involved in cell wall biosynthesis
MKPRVAVIIPAFNESQSIANVIRDIPKDIVDETIVVNNNSSDATAEIARNEGATTLDEPHQGYGRACLKGINFLKQKPASEQPDVIVFLDAYYSDYPEEMELLLKPIVNDDCDLVIGSRALGRKEDGAMMPQQIFGNWLATRLIRLFYGVRFTDLGPFRAIKWQQLLLIEMKDETYGWTVEMQVKAAKHKLKCAEVPVNYRKRIGKSKITGTVKGTVLAGYKIITTIIKYL